MLITDELGFVLHSKTGAELISQRYERLHTDHRKPAVRRTTEVKRLTSALLDRLSHHVDILE